MIKLKKISSYHCKSFITYQKKRQKKKNYVLKFNVKKN